VAIKQLDLDKQSRKEIIMSEILMMRASRHANIVNFIESFFYRNELWIVMEYMEGSWLTDVVTVNLLTEGQIAAVSRETAQGLQHLHEHGVVHRDIKSDDVLLSLNGDIKLSTYHEFPDMIGSLIPDISWLWLLRPTLGSCGRKAKEYVRRCPVLDSARGFDTQGIWPKSGHMVSWANGYGYVPSQ
jgi:serine/threonine protein kinase